MSKRYCMACLEPIEKDGYGVQLSTDNQDASFHQKCFVNVNRKKEKLVPALALTDDEQVRLAELANDNDELKQLVIKILNHE